MSEKISAKHKKILTRLEEEYPLVPHTNAGRLYSTVRRMKAEKENDLPVHLRTGFAISTQTGKAANKMTSREWEEFYKALCGQLEKDYPDLFNK